MRRLLRGFLIFLCLFGYIAANGMFGQWIETINISEDSMNIIFLFFFLGITVVFIFMFYKLWKITGKLSGPSGQAAKSSGPKIKIIKYLIAPVYILLWIAGVGGALSVTSDAVVYYSSGQEFFETLYKQENPLIAESLPAGSYVVFKVFIVLIGLWACWALWGFRKQTLWSWLLFLAAVGGGVLAGSIQSEMNPNVGAAIMAICSVPFLIFMAWRFIKSCRVKPRLCSRCGFPLAARPRGELQQLFGASQRAGFPIMVQPVEWYCTNPKCPTNFVQKDKM